MHLKISFAKWRPYCLSLNVLNLVHSTNCTYRSLLRWLSFHVFIRHVSFIHCLPYIMRHGYCCPRDCHWNRITWSPFTNRDGVSYHRRLDCLLNRLFRCRSKKSSKLRVTCLFEGNSQETCEFPAQRASNAENVSNWWRLELGIRNHLFEEIYSTCNWRKVTFSFIVHIDVGCWKNQFVWKRPTSTNIDIKRTSAMP